jgi:tyrosyl-tRNA synthetase
MRVSEILFGKSADMQALKAISEAEMKTIAGEIPSFQLERQLLEHKLDISSLMSEHTDILSSKSEVRKAIQNNAISINKQKITSHEHPLSMDDLLHHKYLMLENGKKNKYIIEFRS